MLVLVMVMIVVVLIVALVMVIFELVGDVGVSGVTDRSVTSTVMMWCKWG